MGICSRAHADSICELVFLRGEVVLPSPFLF
jgi:hypothetical protein